jgi:hypothetical protein
MQESLIFGVCVYSLRYPACKGACAVLYCHLWSVLTVPYFPTLYKKRNDFRKDVFEQQICCLILSTKKSSCGVPVVLVSLKRT